MVPRGARQQLAYLFVVVALYRAAAERDAHRKKMENTPESERTARQQAVENTLLTGHRDRGREETADRLRHALLWKDTSTVAARAVEHLVAHYHLVEGLIIDIEARTVEIDPTFDAAAQQRRRGLMVEHNHHSRAIGAALAVLTKSATPLPHSVASALVVPATRTDRVALDAELRALGVSESDSRTAIFVLAYLSGNTGDLDCVDEVPVLIDPGEDVKPEVARHLAGLLSGDRLAHREFDSGWWESARKLLNPNDRALADTARSETLAHRGLPIPVLWAGHIDRRQLTSLVWDYRDRIRSAVDAAEMIATVPALDPRDWGMLAGLVDVLAERRIAIEAVFSDDANTLLDIENTRLRHVLDSLDLGDTRVDRLLFVGELALRDTDLSRRNGRGDRIAAVGAAAITGAVHTVRTPAHPQDLSYAGTEALGRLDQHSTYVRLSAIASGHVPLSQGATELTDDIENFLGGTAPDSAAFVVRSEVELWLDSAASQGQEIISRKAAWTQRITGARATGDNGTLAPRELGTPQLTAAEHSDHTTSLIVDALPADIDRTTHSPARVHSGVEPPTGPGVEATAQL
ncbi:hypothetical protein [Nocardia sp. NPDC050710]|uniref:hypothetical protein n=1 Tax=Nocardia sp. NPDC050710 TaxID=3157220 RepID=UPI003405B2D4